MQTIISGNDVNKAIIVIPIIIFGILYFKDKSIEPFISKLPPMPNRTKPNINSIQLFISLSKL